MNPRFACGYIRLFYCSDPRFIHGGPGRRKAEFLSGKPAVGNSMIAIVKTTSQLLICVHDGALQ